MAELFSIVKITVGPEKLTARVLVNTGMPLMTSENIEGTARVYYLLPAIADHTCLGDAGEKFRDCMGNTEVAHLLEHVTVEIMRETGLAGDIVSGRTRLVPGDERTYDIELSCPDDALTIGALSAASFLMHWAFCAPDQVKPDVVGTVGGLRQLVLGLRGELAEPTGGTGDASAAGAAAPAAADELAYPRVPVAPIDTEGVYARPSTSTEPAHFGGAAAE